MRMIGRAVCGGTAREIVGRGREPMRSQHVWVRPHALALVVKRDIVVCAQGWIGADILRIGAASSHGDLGVTSQPHGHGT